jgi:uncharacterized protein (DUF1800 family)
MMMKTRARLVLLGLTFVSVAIIPILPRIHAAGTIPNDARSIAHALDRLAFGARPGEVERIRELGLAAWIDAQLHPERIPNSALQHRIAPFTESALDSPAMMDEPARRGPEIRGMIANLSQAKLLSAVYSERQLEEVLVDFWFNHFNVFARKGRTALYLAEYEREAIRPHVMGSFRELLGRTAKSPAMLFYLDNWLSATSNPQPPFEDRPRFGRPSMMDSDPPQNRRARGLNENYARELLELHTLGVDGGYTQQDVVEVARAFTGWTIGASTRFARSLRVAPARSGQAGQGTPEVGGFRFAPMLHDRGAKKVLGQTIAAGGGIEDGEQVLDIVARHPATAGHLARKLAQRFISDTPPQSVVERAAGVFQKTNGNIREVVRAIVTSPEFFAPEAHRAKVKTPFEFVASALRATNAEVAGGLALVRALAELGMPLYLCQPPTGYDETAETWVSSGGLVNRLNFALAIANGEMQGVELPRSSDPKTVAEAIGSPEFQKQ